MSAFGGEHSPSHRACVFTVYGVGGLHKTTIVSPSSLRTVTGWWSPQNHHRFTVPFAGLAASAATAGGIWVLPDEYSMLGDDLRKNVPHSARYLVRLWIENLDRALRIWQRTKPPGTCVSLRKLLE